MAVIGVYIYLLSRDWPVCYPEEYLYIYISAVTSCFTYVPFAKSSHVIKDCVHLPALGEVNTVSLVGETVGITDVYKRQVLQHKSSAITDESTFWSSAAYWLTCWHSGLEVLGLHTSHAWSQGWVSECPDVKNHKWLLNPVWHRILYSCTHIATVGGLDWAVFYVPTNTV